jgi:hypothetical protein
MFDLARIRKELEGTAPGGPVAWELTVAILSDLLRDAGLVPPSADAWRALAARGTSAAQRPRQLGALAHIVASTSLGRATVAALQADPPADSERELDAFLEAIWPLTAELILGNPFRQEELLRRWIATWRGVIEGEDVTQATRRLEQLDYRRTLAEVEKAEQARLSEATRRAEALRKAREQAEEAARGWRE